ncbi:putative cytochrome oxidase assembly protein [Actinoplanes missouriensis 431]|uniref:Putative cytochrome oxidase assembly protein n=1 Tax=Actinoplanes missouriensis (strain ATCC 14538 / DSM 43046 / CBS 188.64 / JCM 3121 / NBRC 102363 / NCIMB 12654 / NRRL B-3342 / UNCC 431) TaxID=512565 RepID=I0HDV8_ACTM4|nr:COX15/CtaA family protein [Actinoplanes missouriensis]BAL91195.1 putative cytochrome oxidase assembly protein [Actinoplanes missouriensis 431]
MGTRSVRRSTTAALLTSFLIIATGGVVRVSGSGLGCPDWPRCTAGSFTSAAASTGVHGAIEFGNRVLTGVVVLAVGWVIVAAYPHRRDAGTFLWRSAWGQLLVVLLNAVVGGVTVWTGLNPYIVAGHFLAAMLLLASTTVSFDLAHRTGPPRPVQRSTARWGRLVLWTSAASVTAGTVVTGAGPHPGDTAEVTRIPLDWTILTYAHGLLAACALVAVAGCMRAAARHRDRLALHRSRTLLAALSGQAAIGLYQSLDGLPAVAVLLHLAGAALVWSGAVRVRLACPPTAAAPASRFGPLAGARQP